VYLGSVQSSDGRCSADITRLICHEITSYTAASTEDPALHKAGHSTALRPARSSLRGIDVDASDLRHEKAGGIPYAMPATDFTGSLVRLHLDVTARTELPSLADTINRRRLSLFSHVARMDPSTPAHDALDCTIACRMERHPPSGWKRPPGRPRHTWTQQIGNGSTSSVQHEWTHATARGHATRSALRVSFPQAF